MFDHSHCQHIHSQSQKRSFKNLLIFGKKYLSQRDRLLEGIEMLFGRMPFEHAVSLHGASLSAECTSSVAGRLPTLIICKYFWQNPHIQNQFKRRVIWIGLSMTIIWREVMIKRRSLPIVKAVCAFVTHDSPYTTWQNISNRGINLHIYRCVIYQWTFMGGISPCFCVALTGSREHLDGGSWHNSAIASLAMNC